MNGNDINLFFVNILDDPFLPQSTPKIINGESKCFDHRYDGKIIEVVELYRPGFTEVPCSLYSLHAVMHETSFGERKHGFVHNGKVAFYPGTTTTEL